MEGRLCHGTIDSKPWVATIGNFDGLHLGHQLLLKKLKQNALTLKAKTAVFSFSPHPRAVIKPHSKLTLIYPESDKIHHFIKWGADVVYMINFTTEFATLSADEFFKQLLLKFNNLKKIIVGSNFCFGKNRAASTEKLAQLCKNAGVEFEALELIKKNNLIVSSSLMRRLLAESNFFQAAMIANRPWSITASVIKGSGRGAKLGFATANLDIEYLLPIEYGVYGCLVKYQHKTFKAAANYGVKPTFAGQKPVFEVHIIDFDASINGHIIEICPLKKIRSEKKFESVKKLVAAISADVDNVKDNFNYWQKNFIKFFNPST